MKNLAVKTLVLHGSVLFHAIGWVSVGFRVFITGTNKLVPLNDYMLYEEQ